MEELERFVRAPPSTMKQSTLYGRNNGVMRVRNRAFAIYCTVMLSAASLIQILGLCALPSSPLPQLVFIFICLGLLLRSWRIGLTIYPDRIIKHGWWKNQEINRDRIRNIQLVHYRGEMSRGGNSSLFYMPCLGLDDGIVDVPELIAGLNKTWELYEQICDLLEIPFTRQLIPQPIQHRSPPRHAHRDERDK